MNAQVGKKTIGQGTEIKRAVGVGIECLGRVIRGLVVKIWEDGQQLGSIDTQKCEHIFSQLYEID